MASLPEQHTKNAVRALLPTRLPGSPGTDRSAAAGPARDSYLTAGDQGEAAHMAFSRTGLSSTSQPTQAGPGSCFRPASSDGCTRSFVLQPHHLVRERSPAADARSEERRVRKE